MLAAFIITAREGLESFLIVSVILAYLVKTGRRNLISAVYAGVATALVLCLGLGVALAKVANQSLWEGSLGVVAVFMVGSLIIHMWRVGPKLKHQMEEQMASKGTKIGFFFFTVFMMTREGMETALMLFQVKNGRFISGGLIGLVAAAAICWMWTRFSHLVNVRRFFQVTGAYLLIFLLQTMLTAFHELCEAGVLPNSDAWHAATEPYSPDGMYGKWFSFLMVLGIAAWLIVAAIKDRLKRKPRTIKAHFSQEESHV